MKPVAFPNHNCVFAKDQPQYTPLPAYRHADTGNALTDGQGLVTTVWELTPGELRELFKTRRICISVLTFNQALQPMTVSAQIPEPFQEP